MTSSTFPILRFRRILMTGGTGFVGARLCEYLRIATPFAERLMLQRQPSQLVPEGWSAAYVDLLDSEAVRETFRSFQPDAVIHLAAQSSVGQSQVSKELTWSTNFGASFALAQSISKYATNSTVLFVSSSEVYGASFRQGIVDELSHAIPENCYARSKYATELMLSDLLPQECRLVIARPFNQIGPRQDERFVIASFASQIARIEAGQQEAIVRVGNIDVSRDFLDVDDVCNAYIHLLALEGDIQRADCFNVSTGGVYQIRFILEKLLRLANLNCEIIIDPARVRSNDIYLAVGSNKKILQKTKWRPVRTIDDTLFDVLEYARRNCVARNPQLSGLRRVDIDR